MVGARSAVSWRLPRVSVPVALVLFVLVVLGPLVPRWTAQPASRYTLTAAIAEHGTVDLQRYKSALGVDHAVYKGRLRSDKAIGQPLLDVPFYLVGRAFGAEPAEKMRNWGDLGLWCSTLWSSMVPFAILLVLMYRRARRVVARYAFAATFAIGFGTFILPHAVHLYGHVLTALFGFAAFAVAEDADDRPSRLLLAGFLAGAAVATEYHAVIVAGVVFVYVALRARRRAGWMLLGAVPPAIVIGIYQWRAFGAWYHTPFAYYGGVLNGTSSGGYSVPGWRNIDAIFLGSRGLLLVSPIVLLAFGAAIRFARRSTGVIRTHAVVATAIMGGYLLLCAGWSGTPLLEEPGPRYAIPALPFLVVPLAAVWPKFPRLARAATAVGAVFMFAAAFTLILLKAGQTPLTYVRYVATGAFSRNVWAMALGRFGWIPYAVSVTLVALILRDAAARSVPAGENARVAASVGT